MDARVYRKPSQQHPIERATHEALFIHYLVLFAAVIVSNRYCLVAVAKYWGFFCCAGSLWEIEVRRSFAAIQYNLIILVESF